MAIWTRLTVVGIGGVVALDVREAHTLQMAFVIVHVFPRHHVNLNLPVIPQLIVYLSPHDT